MVKLERTYLQWEHLHTDVLQFLSQKWPPGIEKQVDILINVKTIPYFWNSLGIWKKRNWGPEIIKYILFLIQLIHND